MALIQLWYMNSNTSGRPDGSGDGSYDKNARTATVNRWTDKPALVIGTQYHLKTGGKFYEGTCATKSDADPVATFNNLT